MLHAKHYMDTTIVLTYSFSKRATIESIKKHSRHAILVKSISTVYVYFVHLLSVIMKCTVWELTDCSILILKDDLVLEITF